MIATLRTLAGTLATRFPQLPALIQVARLDRPIGIYLLLWPTLWGLWSATTGWPGWHLLLVFSFGVLLTRSAGCIINDIADREFDRSVARTVNRPLTTGVLAVADALVFMGVLLFLALLLVLSTNVATVLLAILAAVIAAVYPLMKRYTYLPQVILGIAFSMGIPMAFTASTGSVPKEAWLLVIANLLWTVAYDTEYAMADRDDDLKLGLRSTAILFADMDKLAIGILQVSFIATLALAAWQFGWHWPAWLGLIVASGGLVYQQWLIRERDRDACLQAFLSNHWAGLAIFLGIVASYQMTPAG